MSKVIAEYRFNQIFPKTFSYLEFYIPLQHVEYIDKNIPNPIVIFKDSPSKFTKILGWLMFSVAVAHGNRRNNSIKIYMKNFLEVYSDLDIDTLNIYDEKVLIKISKLIDSQPRFQNVLIHEYTHLFQSKYKMPDFSKKIGLPGTFKATAHGLAGIFSRKYGVRSMLELYALSPWEIEARLAQWIFLKFKNYDSYTISALDYTLGKDINKIKQDYDAIVQALEEKKYLNRKEKRILELKMYEYEYYLEIYSKITEECDRIVGILRERFDQIQ